MKCGAVCVIIDAMEREHPYKKFENDLKAGRVKNILLLFGKEQYLVKWAVGAILKKYVKDECRAFDYFEIGPDSVTMESIVENCETLSMFSEKRVIRLVDFGGKMKGFAEADEKLLAEYLKSIPPSCLLVITSENIDKRKKLYKEIVSHGDAYDFDRLDERSLKNFIVKRFNSMGKKISAPSIEELIRQSGYFHKEADYTLYNIENEIKKIAGHADGDEIMVSDILEVISGDIETNVFAMIDAVSGDRKEDALRLLYNILDSDGSVFQVVALLASQFEIILKVKEMKAEGMRFGEIQAMLNAHEFRVRKALEAADLYPVARLRDTLTKIYQVERDVKSGLLDGTLALEVLISGV